MKALLAIVCAACVGALSCRPPTCECIAQSCEESLTVTIDSEGVPTITPTDYCTCTAWRPLVDGGCR